MRSLVITPPISGPRDLDLDLEQVVVERLVSSNWSLAKVPYKTSA